MNPNPNPSQVGESVGSYSFDDLRVDIVRSFSP